MAQLRGFYFDEGISGSLVTNNRADGPVWVTEFADTRNGSPDAEMNFSTREAALGFSELLGRLWPSGIDGIIDFRLADTYADYFEGWVGHGLFSDSRGTLTHGRPYEPYPAYWVFSNFYRELGGRQLVRATAPKKLTVVAARTSGNSIYRLAVWVSNYTKNNYNALLRITNCPAKSAHVKVIDNLVGDTPIENTVVEGEELTLKVNIPKKNKTRLMPGVFWALIKKPYWLQAVSKCEVSWPSKVELADWNRNIPTPQDDGLHFSKSPFYFEWWYFDATFGEGSSVSVIFHFTDLINPLSGNGSVNITVFDQGILVFQRFMPHPTNRIDAAQEMCDVQIGKNRCFQENNKYRIQIDESDIKAELIFESDSIGWRPGNGKFNFADENAFFAWVVPQPKAKVNGYIIINGKKSYVSGVGYHDHNWGTVSLLDTVTEWSWGRVYLRDSTCIFADIQLSLRYGGARILPFSLIHGNQVLISSFLQDNVPLDPNNDFLRNPAAVEFPDGWRLNWTEANNNLNLTLKTQNVLEKTDLLPGKTLREKIIDKLVAHPYYIRCYVAAKGELVNQGRSFPTEGHGIYEQMSLRR